MFEEQHSSTFVDEPSQTGGIEAQADEEEFKNYSDAEIGSSSQQRKMRLLNGTMSVIQETDEEVEETFFNNSIASLEKSTGNCNCTLTTNQSKRKASNASNKSKKTASEYLSIKVEQVKPKINNASHQLPRPRPRGEKTKEFKGK